MTRRMRRKISSTLSLLSLILMIALTSCGDKAIYDQTYSFDDKSWDKGDTAVFKVDIQDTLQIYDFMLTLRTTKNYLYSNLWIYVEVDAPDGTTSKVAEKLPLANPDGSWIGRVSGTLIENKIRFDSKHFPLKGEYVFKITNATQDESISEILDVGLRIE